MTLTDISLMFNNRFIEYNKHDADWSKMISNEKPYYLVKFIDKKWADRLMDGEVFMRAIACFGDAFSNFLGIFYVLQCWERNPLYKRTAFSVRHTRTLL